MNVDLDDKVILVTGGTGALGAEVSEAFLKLRPKVIIITYRSEGEKNNLEKNLSELKSQSSGKINTIIEYLKVNVLDEEDVRSLIEYIDKKYGGLNSLANIVGGYIGGKPIEETTLEDWEKMLSINLKSAFLLTKHAINSMKKRSYGKIVHVSSASGEKASGNDSAYSCSKAGLIRLVESVKEEVKDKGININCILPTIINTKANRDAMPGSDFSKWISPNNLAEIIIYLCSENSRVINGAAIRTFGRT